MSGGSFSLSSLISWLGVCFLFLYCSVQMLMCTEVSEEELLAWESDVEQQSSRRQELRKQFLWSKGSRWFAAVVNKLLLVAAIIAG